MQNIFILKFFNVKNEEMQSLQKITAIDIII